MKCFVVGAVAAVVLLMTSASAAQPGDEQTLSLMVQARTRGCTGHAGTREPLRWSDAVVRAAQRMDRGEPPLTALDAEGYRATRVFHASLSGYRSAADAAEAVAQHYCAALTDPGFKDFGFHRNGAHWLVVLAAPLEVPQLGDARAAVAQVLALANDARAHPRRCGDKSFGAAAPLRWNARLEAAAAQHARDMAVHSFLDHRGTDGSTPSQRITRAGYRWRSVGENVASGQTTPQEVVADWLRSPGHCANLMNPGFTEMGAGFAVNLAAQAAVFWAQEFGTPR